MRILFFSRSLCGGGAERVLSNLSSELASKGHDIFIAINEYEESYPIDERVHMIIAPQLDSYKGNNPLRRIYRRVIRSHRNSIHTCDTINSVHPDVIVTFLSVLELMKSGLITTYQENTFDDIIITAKDVEQTGE